MNYDTASAEIEQEWQSLFPNSLLEVFACERSVWLNLKPLKREEAHMQSNLSYIGCRLASGSFLLLFPGFLYP